MGIRIYEKLITFFFDIVAFNIAYAAMYWLRYKSNFFPETFDPNIVFSDYITPSLIFCVPWIVLFFFTGLYRNWYKESRLDEFLVVSRTVLFGTFLLFLMISADEIQAFVISGKNPQLLSHTQIISLSIYTTCMLLSATINRFAIHTLITWFFAKGFWVNNVIIIGASEEGKELHNEIINYPQLGYKVIGFIDDDGRKKGTTCADLPVFGTYSDLSSTIKRYTVSGIIISHVSASPNEIMKILNYCEDARVTIYMVPTLMDVITGHLKTHQIFGIPLIVLLHDHMPSWQAQIKRIIDVSIALVVLIVGAPICLLVGYLIRTTSPGPIIFKQERIGQNGKPFHMLKFRSMYEDAEKRSGPQWAKENDPRITPFGRFLRKTRLDEIPQFINVLKGEMSLVGPRPERAFFIEKLKQEIPWYIRRIKMKPGITGWAQVKHKYDESIEDVKQKVLYDLYYFENMSLLLDLKIILRTVIVVFTGKGAH